VIHRGDRPAVDVGRGLSCGLDGVWMIYDSKIGRSRRDTYLDKINCERTRARADVGCGLDCFSSARPNGLDRRASGHRQMQQEDLSATTQRAR